jgi:hypothetical protein
MSGKPQPTDIVTYLRRSLAQQNGPVLASDNVWSSGFYAAIAAAERWMLREAQETAARAEPRYRAVDLKTGAWIKVDPPIQPRAPTGKPVPAPEGRE